jgi:hypothetical protein
VPSSSCPYSCPCPCADGIAHDVVWSLRRYTQHACLLLLPLARFSSLRPSPIRCVSFLLVSIRSSPLCLVSSCLVSLRLYYWSASHRFSSLGLASPLLSISYSILCRRILVQAASSSTTQRTATRRLRTTQLLTGRHTDRQIGHDMI